MKDTGYKLKARFTIVEQTPDLILIRDEAREEDTMSVINDAENVVECLHRMGVINHKMLYYIDTDDRVDVLEHDNNGTFLDFRAGYDSIEDFYEHKFGIKIK